MPASAFSASAPLVRAPSLPSSTSSSSRAPARAAPLTTSATMRGSPSNSVKAGASRGDDVDGIGGASKNERASPSPSPASASAAPPNVAELVMLLKIDPEQDANAVLDELWSAQYLAPGTLCAFAGETAAGTASESPPASPSRRSKDNDGGGGGDGGGGDGGDDKNSSSPTPSSPFTHALHMRFPNPKACSAFVAHPAFSAAREKAEEAAAAAAAAAAGGGQAKRKRSQHLVVAFEGRVDPPSLETLFRRGAEWESGVEHVMVLSSEAGDKEGSSAADEFVAQLRELAESSLAGAVQSTAGRVFPVSVEEGDDDDGVSLRPTHAVLTRFAAEEQLRAFLALPPVRALFSSASEKENDDDASASAAAAAAAAAAAPVKAVAWAHYSIAPPQGVTGKQGA